MLGKIYERLLHHKNIMVRVVESILSIEAGLKKLAQEALDQIDLQDAWAT